MPSNTIDLPIQNSEKLLFEEEAQKIIKGFTLAATGGGLIPNPIAAISTSVTTQVLMIRELCYLFDVPFDGHALNVVVNSVAGSVISKFASLAISSMIPGASPSEGLDLSSAGVTAVYTATVGEFYKVHFQNGGNLENASINDIGSYFMDEIHRKDLNMNSVANPISTIKHLFLS